MSADFLHPTGNSKVVHESPDGVSDGPSRHDARRRGRGAQLEPAPGTLRGSRRNRVAGVKGESDLNYPENQHHQESDREDRLYDRRSSLIGPGAQQPISPQTVSSAD